MNFLIENWYIIIAGIAVLVAALVAIKHYLGLPTAQQIAAIKEWLLWAVVQAEADLGSGTGQLKLRYVYDLFVTQFPWAAKVISFDLFSKMVDEALDRMREMLKANPAVAALIETEQLTPEVTE